MKLTTIIYLFCFRYMNSHFICSMQSNKEDNFVLMKIILLQKFKTRNVKLNCSNFIINFTYYIIIKYMNNI